MPRLYSRMLAAAAIGVCSVSLLVAQSDTGAKELIGNWIYRLGPNALFALHLELDPTGPQKIRGYLLHPERFNLNTSNGVLLRFSGITNQSQRDPIVSLGWDKDSLRLGQAPSAEATDKAKTGDELIFSVHPTDATHLDLNLFAGMPPLPMEHIEGDPKLAANWDSARNYTADDFVPDNAEMNRIVTADQADRIVSPHTDWQKVSNADADRRVATAALLHEGQLRTGNDFDHAALVFQHGSTPDDFLLGHVLAVIAVSKGDIGAVWISAATLDRYLQNIHQPQIFGTQFGTPQKAPASQEPYNRALLSDSLRASMGVPSQAAQNDQRKHLDTQNGFVEPPSTSTPR